MHDLSTLILLPHLPLSPFLFLLSVIKNPSGGPLTYPLTSMTNSLMFRGKDSGTDFIPLMTCHGTSRTRRDSHSYASWRHIDFVDDIEGSQIWQAFAKEVTESAPAFNGWVGVIAVEDEAEGSKIVKSGSDRDGTFKPGWLGDASLELAFVLEILLQSCGWTGDWETLVHTSFSYL
ncbi:hypothetical protein E6O75_ATG05586 [Venturia nashicola]|uniref:Uncharacterized protein n=1 Tax=Venturia nashicola TaxID=86259 RepID=A0A4Z1P8G3_9PEZI|nr:hypothetical protein E6O75_ATG05586 [Venturia nashicola]